jgi:phosphatidylserine synthase
MGLRVGFFGAFIPATAILAVTLVAAIHPRLQGILITGVGIALFILAMLLIPRLKLERATRAASSPPQAVPT